MIGSEGRRHASRGSGIWSHISVQNPTPLLRKGLQSRPFLLWTRVRTSVLRCRPVSLGTTCAGLPGTSPRASGRPERLGNDRVQLVVADRRGAGLGGLTQLDHERRKLLQLHYRDAIPPDLFEDEQQRITREMETANARLTVIDQVFADIQDTLDRALKLGQNCHPAYLAARPPVRRLINQAFFQALYINDDAIRSELAEPFAILLGDELTQEAEATLAQEAKDPSSNTGTTGPTSTSEPHTQDVKGSNKALLVEVMGFEPTTSSMRPKRSSQLSYTPERDDSG
jgi:hypothetical protein